MTDMPQNTSTPAAETATPVEARLEQILLEAEASLRSLREELEEQRRFAQQHQQIDRLPEHLAQTSHKWAGVKIFLDDLVSDFRRLRDTGEQPQTGPADDAAQDRSR